MRRLILAALLITAPLLAGCNTIKGVGEDITKAGEVLEEATK